MPLQPLFQYANGLNLKRLQQLADDIKAYGVIRTDEFSEAVLIKSGDAHFNEALDIVIAEISAWHRDDSPYEPTHPDYDETFADTHPRMFFVTVDDEDNYVPPARESSPSNPESTEKPPREDSAIYPIAGYFINEYIIAKAKEDPRFQPADDIMDAVANGRATVIGLMHNSLDKTLIKKISLDSFSRYVKSSAQKYISKKK